MPQMFKYLRLESRVVSLLGHCGRHPTRHWIRHNVGLAQTGPDLKHFMADPQPKPFVAKRGAALPYVKDEDLDGNGSKVFVKTYGCQMNVNDTQITKSILTENGYQLVEQLEQADIVLLMTCAIRENAEIKVWNKLNSLSKLKTAGRIKQIGLLGCIAERMKTEILDKHRAIDVIVGPDGYRDLPKLLAINRLNRQKAVNVLLSLEETYADVMPTMTINAVTGFVSIMRGCDNMCSYCVVPFTRGRERSRPIDSIVSEVKHMSESGVREVTLLGQNVNSYRDMSGEGESSQISLAPGFSTVYKPKTGGLTFDVLLDTVAKVDPNMRIRFTSPHPKDFDERVLRVMATNHNICKSIHLPAQSGSDSVLKRMRRGYTKEAYLSLVDRIRHIMPDCALSSDFICGFCGETEDEHKETVDLVRRVGYNSAYVFAYSMRNRTHAFHQMSDDVPQEVKIERLQEICKLYREMAFIKNKSSIGSPQLILIEGLSKKSDQDLYGRNEANLKVIVPKTAIPVFGSEDNVKDIEVGDYVLVRVKDCSTITLIADPICHKPLSQYMR